MYTEIIYFFLFLGLILLILPDHHLPISKKHKDILGIICLVVTYYYFNNEKLF